MLNMFADPEEFETSLGNVKAAIHEGRQDPFVAARGISISLASDIISKFSSLEDEEVAKRCIETQAAAFWIRKRCPFQATSVEKGDYTDAMKHVGFLVSDYVLSTCSRDQSCPITNLSPSHLKLMQNVTVSDFINTKAYFNWVERTGEVNLSTADERVADFTKAKSYLHESLVLCNSCSSVENYNYWKYLYKSVLAEHEHITLEAIRSIAETRIELLHNYCEYAFKFFAITRRFINEDLNVPWEEVRNLVDFIHKNPCTTTVYELLMLRVLIATRFHQHYINLTTKDDNDNLEAYTKAQAWLFYFMKLCPKQDKETMDNDFYNARRYIAYLLFDHIVNDGLAKDRFTWSTLTKEKIKLLQGLHLGEYCRHKSYSAWRARLLARDGDTSPMESWDVTLDPGPQRYPSMDAETLVTLLDRTEILPQDDIKRAKFHTLLRLSKASPEYTSCSESVVEVVYPKIRKLIEGDSSPDLVLPYNCEKHKDVYNTFEYLLACVTPGPVSDDVVTTSQ